MSSPQRRSSSGARHRKPRDVRHRGVRAARQAGGVRRRTGGLLGVAAAAAVFALTALTALAPPPGTAQAEVQYDTVEFQSQTLRVPAAVAAAVFERDGYTVTEGVQTLALGGTNHDWAKMVLLLGNFPLTDSNITVMTRWMRQENGTNNWWNRNNPLNNGWGSGGGAGLGSYDSLVIAAENAAEALHGNPSYHDIVAGFNSSAPTEVIEQAIWASPWASSHYGNGTHWAYTPVPVVESPSGTWG